MSDVDAMLIGNKPAREVLDKLFADIKEKDVEIERLNTEYSALQKRYDTLWRTQYNEIERLKSLILKIERTVTHGVAPHYWPGELVNVLEQAREATKDE